MKILHITTDNKFIGHAMQTFEDVYPQQNEVWVFTSSTKLNSPINNCKKVSFKQIVNPFFSAKLKKYDLVILHSFHNYWIFIVFFASKNINFAWLGWGFDYYDYIYKKPELLMLGGTRKINKLCFREGRIKNTIESVVIFLLDKFFKASALKKIKSFSPVLKEDYNLIEKARLIPYLAPFVAWNYGSLEENLVKDFIGERVSGENVLVGGSASFTNNHMEAFQLLKELGVPKEGDRKVFVPISYGDDCCKKQVLKLGEELLGGSFCPLIKFMPISEYVGQIKKCGFVIMNHIRQEAVGNILIMIYMGARVFLRQENPTYHFLKNEGVVLNTIGELSQNSELLQLRLSNEEIKNNIKVLHKHWSKNVIDEKTRELVKFHLGDSID